MYTYLYISHICIFILAFKHSYIVDSVRKSLNLLENIKNLKFIYVHVKKFLNIK